MASEQITAIDIGTNSVKVAQFEKDTEIKLVNLGIADYPRESATEEVDDEVIASTLKDVFDHKIKTKSVVLSIPRELVTSRKMTNFPATATDEQIKNMVETQAEAELPFGTSETVFDYHNLVRAEGQISVDLVAARRDAVQKYIDILEQIGIEPILILPSTYASAALAMSQLSESENNEMVMLVDIGAGRTDLCIFRAGHILFNRSIPVGGNDLTRLYEVESELTFEEAEERKRTTASLIEETPATVSIKEWADDLTLEIERSIQAASRNLLDRSSKPNSLWLCGGGSQIPGIGQYISEQLEIPVNKWNPLSAISNIQTGVTDEVSGMSSRFAVALGLGINAFDNYIDLNLVLPEIVEKKEQTERRQKTIRYAIAAAAVIILIFAGITGWGQYRKSQLNSVVEQINQHQDAKKEAMSSLTQDLIIMNMLEERVSVLDILRELTVELPKRTEVALTTFKAEKLDELDQASLTINAEASSYENISQLISRIGNSDFFTKVRPGQVNSTGDERKQVFQVQIRCQLASNAKQLIVEEKEQAMNQPSGELAIAKSEEQLPSEEMPVESEIRRDEE